MAPRDIHILIFDCVTSGLHGKEVVDGINIADQVTLKQEGHH